MYVKDGAGKTMQPKCLRNGLLKMCELSGVKYGQRSHDKQRWWLCSLNEKLVEGRKVTLQLLYSLKYQTNV